MATKIAGGPLPIEITSSIIVTGTKVGIIIMFKTIMVSRTTLGDTGNVLIILIMFNQTMHHHTRGENFQLHLGQIAQ